MLSIFLSGSTQSQSPAQEAAGAPVFAKRQPRKRLKSRVSLQWCAGDFGQWLGGRDMVCVACLPRTTQDSYVWDGITVMGSQVPSYN